MLARLLTAVAPPACVGCRAPLHRADEVVCAPCRRALPWLDGPLCPRCALPLDGGGAARGADVGGAVRSRRSALAAVHAGCPAARAPFDAAWAAVAYEGVARELLVALKFRAARPLAELMAAQVAAGMPPVLMAGATVVAVPAHPSRRRQRGFDPAALVAEGLARRAGLPVARRVLRRAGAPVRQLGASRPARLQPGRLAFVARAPPPAVLLVDDVHTTGATLAAAAAAVRAAGTRRVVAATWARTLR